MIASKGRVQLLGELLESLVVARNNFSGDSEVILVDDSNSEDLVKIEVMCQMHDARRIFFSPSVAEKRNVGAHNANYNIILFLDSDCLATPQLLNEHFKLYTEEQVGAVAGLIEFIGENTWFWKAVEKSPFVVCFGLPRWLEQLPWTPTANCSVRKSVFEKVDGFDREFTNKSGAEDVDLGLRITKMGYIFKCSKEGLVFHQKETWISVKEMAKRLWYYGSGDYFLVHKHRDYTMGVLPRKSLIYALVLIMLGVIGIAKSPVYLVLFPLWVLADLSISSFAFKVFSPHKRASFLQQFVIQLMIFDNELGYVFRCLRKGKPGYLFRQMMYFDGQLKGALSNGAISTWANYLSLMLLAMMISLI